MGLGWCGSVQVLGWEFASALVLGSIAIKVPPSSGDMLTRSLSMSGTWRAIKRPSGCITLRRLYVLGRRNEL